MTKRSEKMATWPIPKLLFSMGIPAVFSMLIQALYNIVDTVFISQYSQDAMFAIGLAFPLQMTGLSLALGLGVGTGTQVRGVHHIVCSRADVFQTTKKFKSLTIITHQRNTGDLCAKGS